MQSWRHRSRPCSLVLVWPKSCRSFRFALSLHPRFVISCLISCFLLLMFHFAIMLFCIVRELYGKCRKLVGEKCDLEADALLEPFYWTECCGTMESSLPGTLHSHCDRVPPMQPHGFAHCLCKLVYCSCECVSCNAFCMLQSTT